MKDKTISGADRRRFLKTAGLGAVAGASLAVAGTAAKAQPADKKAAADKQPAGKGYQETEHVKRYYALARM